MHKHATLADIANDPDALNSLEIADLRALWAQYFPKKPPSPHRGCLIRDLAWYAQAKFEGGMAIETRQLLQKAMAEVSVSRQLLEIPTSAPRPVAPTLMKGAMLVRVWNGRRHVA